jgi:hypothetical protein
VQVSATFPTTPAATFDPAPASAPKTTPDPTRLPEPMPTLGQRTTLDPAFPRSPGADRAAGTEADGPASPAARSR